MGIYRKKPIAIEHGSSTVEYSNVKNKSSNIADIKDV